MNRSSRASCVMRSFDEARLRVLLSELPQDLRSAFSAACAQRLAPAYNKYWKVSGSHADDKVTAALEALWDDLRGVKPLGDEELDSLSETVLQLVPDEDEASNAGTPYAEDAAAAVAFALRVRRTGAIQDAVWAARRVYEVLDNYVIRAAGEQDIDEEKALSHPLIQRELERQERDISLLQSAIRANQAKIETVNELKLN